MVTGCMVSVQRGGTRSDTQFGCCCRCKPRELGWSRPVALRSSCIRYLNCTGNAGSSGKEKGGEQEVGVRSGQSQESLLKLGFRPSSNIG